MRLARWLVLAVLIGQPVMAAEPPADTPAPDLSKTAGQLEGLLKKLKDQQKKHKSMSGLIDEALTTVKQAQAAVAAAGHAQACCQNTRKFTVLAPSGKYLNTTQLNQTFVLDFSKCDRLTIEVKLGDKKADSWVRFEADYAVNQDGMVFGVITYAGPEPWVKDQSLALKLQKAVHQPFVLSGRVGDEGKKLTLTGIRLQELPPELLANMLGEYGR